MSFLNALFLFGLPIAAAPIVLHLLRRQRQHVVEWGAMQFLTDAVGEGRRFDKLEEWLLLALRTAALLALVLALARPLVRGLSPSSATSQEVILVLDDSLSTDRTVDGERVFDQLRDKAQQQLDALQGSESVRVMLAAAGPRWLNEQPTFASGGGLRELRTQLAELQPTRGAANFLGCLRLATSHQGAGEQVARRVIVFADQQLHGWQVDSRRVWSKLKEGAETSGRDISFEVVQFETPPLAAANLSLDGVRASHWILGQGESTRFTAEISNTGASESSPTTVLWAVDSKQRGGVDIPAMAAGERRTVEWRTTIEEQGVFDIAAKLEASDELSLDNDAGVVVEVVKAVPVLVLAESDDLEAPQNAFLSAALGYRPDEPAGAGSSKSSWKSLFRPQFVPLEDAERQELAKYHAVVVSSLGELSDRAVEKLESYVRSGGGLWLMLGTRIDREQFNRQWYRQGGGLCPLALGALVRPADSESSEALVHPPTGEHPATAMLADTDRLDIDRVRLRRYHSFRRQRGVDFLPLLESGRGAPLAMLNFVDDGRVIVQAFPLRREWSDLVISKSLVVMVHDWLAYLTQPAATRFNLASREPFVHLLSDEPLEQATVTNPTGEAINLTRAEQQGMPAVRFAGTALPGHYELKFKQQETETTWPLQVARDAQESQLTPLAPGDLSMLSDAAGIRFVDQPSATAPAENSTARLEPAWWPLLFAVVCLMAAESLLATRVSRSRFGAVAT